MMTPHLTEPLRSVSVIGAGSWGMALALALRRSGCTVCLWLRDTQRCAALQHARQDSHYLPGITLPDDLLFTTELRQACEFADDLLLVVPSRAFTAVIQQVLNQASPRASIAWASKGLNPITHQPLHVSYTALAGAMRPFAVISGPSFAGEVAAGLPTAVTVASPDTALAYRWAQALSSESLRAYTTDDVLGVELGGATKNVLAIAAGIADGLHYGANARAALITRGLSEIMRLGAALGARTETLMGLAGLGDLVLTCTDNQSRNRRLGLLLAQGLSLPQALAQIGQAVEGVTTAGSVMALAQQYALDLPICAQVYRILHEGLDPHQAAHALLSRTLKPEYPL